MLSLQSFFVSDTFFDAFVEVSSNYRYVSFVICCVLLDRLVHFLDVMVPHIPSEGNTLISLMHWRLTMIVVEVARVR